MLNKFLVFLFIVLTFFSSNKGLNIRVEKTLYKNEQSSGVISYDENVDGYENIDYLNDSYHGSFKDRGIYEISSNPGGEIDFDLDFQIQNEDGVNLLFSILLNKKENIIDNDLLKPLGIEVCYLDINQEVKKEGCLQICHNINELPSSPTDEEHTFLVNTFSRGELYFYESFGMSMVVRFRIYPKEKIRYVRFYYSDVPTTVIDASIIADRDDFLATITNTNNEEYVLDERKLNEQTIYYLSSPYKRCYSKQYLKRFYFNRLYKDESDIQIYDPDNYFISAYMASIGTIYLVSLIVSQTGEEYVFVFTVEDNEPPFVYQKKELESISYKQQITNEFINDYFFIQESSGDDVEINILDENQNKIDSFSLGEHELVLEVSHKEKKTLWPFSILVIDDIPPIIVQTQKEIILSSSYIISNTNLLSFFSCNDEVDNECLPFIIENTYSNSNGRKGIYNLEVGGKDKNNNQDNKNLKIIIDEGQSVFYADYNSFVLFKDHLPSLQQVAESLIRQGVIDNKNYLSYHLVEGTIFTNDLDEGVYELTLSCLGDDNKQELIDIQYEIRSKLDDIIQDSFLLLEKRKTSILEKVFVYVYHLLEGLISFFIER